MRRGRDAFKSLEYKKTRAASALLRLSVWYNAAFLHLFSRWCAAAAAAAIENEEEEEEEEEEEAIELIR